MTNETPSIEGLRDRIRQYMEITQVVKIARRYFVMNAFDGAMTVLGMVVGFFANQVVNPVIVIIGGVGACVAMSISGAFGAYFAEKAERHKELARLERAMITDLEDTLYGRAERFASFFVSFIDGLSPLIGVGLLIPFVFTQFGLIAIELTYIISMGISVLILAVLGAYLGRISGENIVFSTVKMAIAGFVTAFTIILISGIPVG